MAHADGNALQAAIVQRDPQGIGHSLEQDHVHERDDHGRFGLWTAALADNWAAFLWILSFTDEGIVLSTLAPEDGDLVARRTETFSSHALSRHGSEQVFFRMQGNGLKDLTAVGACAMWFQSMYLYYCANAIMGLQALNASNGTPATVPVKRILADEISRAADSFPAIRDDQCDLYANQQNVPQLPYSSNMDHQQTHMKNVADVFRWRGCMPEKFMKIVRLNAGRHPRLPPNHVIFKAYKSEAISISPARHNNENIIAYCLVYKRLERDMPMEVIRDRLLPYV